MKGNLKNLRAGAEGWEFEDDEGTHLSLAVVAAPLLRQKAIDSGLRQLERQLGEKLGQGGPISMAAVRRLCVGQRLTEVEKGSLRAAVCGGLWPESRLQAAGYESDGCCTQCSLQKRDTLFHRVWECPSTQDLRKSKAVQQWTREAFAAGELAFDFSGGGMLLDPTPALPAASDSAAWRNDAPIFDAANGPIYVDGSCVPMGIRGASRAAWAAVQVNAAGQVAHAISGPVPRTFPQTAQAGEHLAAATASRAAVDGRVTIVGDCLTVVQTGLRGSIERASKGKRPYDGARLHAWRGRGADSLRRFEKVKAHQDPSKVEDARERQRCLGNGALRRPPTRGALGSMVRSAATVASCGVRPPAVSAPAKRDQRG